ncbi:helix-hairpin-helix domain-containing protein [Aquimarina sp. U1-2]|uniref:ComEA family DNA-binding protein n=1 Tax=Aquimarina sp. U1-2 TaxID=2823141 RepID=UPI001AEC8D72|nr:helix-hairpin-helix domain-containing protein [Aquimarina sp. U1-2]MBP2832217.1 helix-hairpin-helix domain-containing protein [Aquimarina sp. U1-2]
MNTLKSHFEMHLRFRNGILVLSLLIVLSILLFIFYPYTKVDQQNFVELKEFQQQVDSLKRIAIQQRDEVKLKTFNPNFISDFKGYQLGLSPKELDRLTAFRQQGKWVNSIADFKKVTQVSDSLLSVIAPLFKFPDWLAKRTTVKREYKKRTITKTLNQKGDLNTVTAATLQQQIELPDFIARRIVNYRNKIGGFIHDLQLKDVSGLFDNQRRKILASYTVKTSKPVKKININEASIKQLLEIPYFDFETAIEIKDLIDNHGIISDFNELGKIEGFSLEKIDRIALYLTLK